MVAATQRLGTRCNAIMADKSQTGKADSKIKAPIDPLYPASDREGV
jgi:hypothetical protein